jgi:hypothetical protein
MSTQSIVALLLSVFLLLLTACASVLTTSREPYHGVDKISSVEAASLVGRWKVNELNPRTDAPPQQTVIEYFADGTVQGLISLNGADLPGSNDFRLSGNWTLQGDTVSHTDITMKSLDDSAFGAMLSDMINNSEQDLGGVANIQELSETRMVFLGSDGATMEYIRELK